MKKVLIFLSLLICINISSTENFEKSAVNINPEKIKILTWNVQMLPSIGSIFSRKLKKMQTERTEWIIDYLSKEDYDVVLLQESFDNDFINELNEKLKHKYPFQLNPIRPNWYKLSNGLMVLSKIPFQMIDKVTFSSSSQSDFFAAKGAVMVKVFIDSVPLYIVNTHLQSDYDSFQNNRIRTKQLDEIKSKLLVNIGHDSSKIVLAGDFNVIENVESKEYIELINKFNLVDLVYNFFKKPSISFDKNNYWNQEEKKSSRLDYFLTNLDFKLVDIQIVKAKHKYNNHDVDLADHYGISAEFRID